jgi:hypothetical protein
MVRNGDRAVPGGMKDVIRWLWSCISIPISDDPESEELCQYVRDGIERLAVDSVMRSKTGSQFRVARTERVKRVDNRDEHEFDKRPI